MRIGSGYDVHRLVSDRELILGGVKTIGEYAFRECKNLTTLTFEEGVKEIGQSAFYKCNLQTVVIPNSVTKIGDFAFQGNSSLTSVSLPNTLTSVDTEKVFRDCSSSLVINNRWDEE